MTRSEAMREAAIALHGAICGIDRCRIETDQPGAIEVAHDELVLLAEWGGETGLRARRALGALLEHYPEEANS